MNIHGIVAGILTLIVVVFFIRRSEYKKLTPLQRAYRGYGKAKPGSCKRKAMAEIIDREIITILDKCTESRELKEKYDDMVYWTPESTDNEGLPVIDFFNKRFAELNAKKAAEKERYEHKNAKKEEVDLKRANEATNANEAKEAHRIALWHNPSKRIALERWQWFSLLAVLNAKTHKELYQAKSEAPDGSLAVKFVPYMHEHLSRVAVDTANTIDELVIAGDKAPDRVLSDTALYVCFQKLHQRLKTQPITIKKVA